MANQSNEDDEKMNGKLPGSPNGRSSFWQAATSKLRPKTTSFDRLWSRKSTSQANSSTELAPTVSIEQIERDQVNETDGAESSDEVKVGKLRKRVSKLIPKNIFWFRRSAQQSALNPMLHMAAVMQENDIDTLSKTQDGGNGLSNVDDYWAERDVDSSIASLNSDDDVPYADTARRDSNVSLVSDAPLIGIDMSNLSTSRKLEMVFDLPPNEVYVTEFACWLVTSLLLKGYMYVTENHICFYSTMPPIADSTLKASYLQKLKRRRPTRKYETEWFVLKRDGLYSYHDQSKLYYPASTIYLKNVLSIRKSTVTKNGIKLTTTSKTYTFKADTELQANEWIDAINVAVFNAKNSGNDIKAVLPFSSIENISIETTSFNESALKITILSENDVTDEYWFSYFTNLPAAKELLDDLLQKSKMRPVTISTEELESTTFEKPPLDNKPSKLLTEKSGLSIKRNSIMLTVSANEDRNPFDLAPPVGAGHRRTNSDGELNTSNALIPPEKGLSFKANFAVPETEVLLTTFSAYLIRTLPLYGKVYISTNYLCFKSTVVGFRSKVVIPISDINSFEKGKSFSPFSHVVTVKTKNFDEIHFDFYGNEDQEKCLELLSSLKSNPALNNLNINDETRFLIERIDHVDQHVKSTFSKDELGSIKPFIPQEPAKPPRKMHITCFTIGTRGDVQPFIALCLGLMKDGHTCRLATHIEFKDWIEKFGIEFAPVKGDPAELIQLCIDHDMLSVGFVREALSKFLGWIDELLISCSEACKGTDMLIEAPTGFGGIHVAEMMQIPFFSAFPMPWTRTRAFPHPFGVPEWNMGSTYNYMTHVVIEEALGKGLVPSINRWRKSTLGLDPVGFTLDDRKTPYLYSFSPSIVTPPSDWPDWIHICGYWFLENPEPDWVAPESLLTFLKDGPPPVYIGFGSIIVSDPDEMTRMIIEASEKANVRIILSKGWSARGKETTAEITYPPHIYPLDKVPHDWLFPQCAGVFHHGGAGTTAAGLRAGVPTIIKPFFGDQYFWAIRVQEMGVGVSMKKLTVNNIYNALIKVTTDERMKVRAQEVGRQIRSEDGVRNAINYIYRDMDYALERVKHLALIHKKS